MASSHITYSNVVSSSVPNTSGNVVVTHVLPAAPSVEQRPPLDGRKFRKGHPKALGAVQIVIGLMTLLFGIAAAVSHHSFGVYSGIFVWGSLIYISSGSVTVAAEKHLSRCLINSSLVLNIIAAVVGVIGVILYALDPAVFYHPYYRHSRSPRHPGYSVVLAVFQLLEVIISVTMAAFACNASCGCCTEQPQVYVQPAEAPTAPQAHFQAASVAPAQPHPQAAPNLKNPWDPSSAQPPAYQPY